MGLFFKKKITGNYPHLVTRKDWENVLDALFRNTIANNPKGVAVISNTDRQNKSDVDGTVQTELVYHIKLLRIDQVREGLKKIDMVYFESIFDTYFNSEQEKSLDFYRIKNILQKEIMAYPLVQGERKRGLLVFDYPMADSNMVHTMKIIKDVLNNPEVQPTPAPPSNS